MRLVLATLLLALAACRASSPAPGPEARCADACQARASGCSDAQCVRGCRFVVDKLVEREGDRVLACVARETGPARHGCDDATFAGCAVLTGIHADGGPPAPPPKTDVDIAGEDDKKSGGDDDL